MTKEQKARAIEEFELYFADLKKSLKAEGATVPLKSEEKAVFLANWEDYMVGNV